MKILISNDDGIDSPGIQALAIAAKQIGEVTVVAPHRERSTAGHSLTLHKPLRINKVAEGQYTTSGTPADCIYLGIREVLAAPPDLILSGINKGANLGTDVHYSGTVAASREGALMNIKSYAFSLVHHKPYNEGVFHFETAAEWAVRVIKATMNVPFPRHTFLNVNFPNVPMDRIKGTQIARQGFRFYTSEVTKRTDPRGKDYYWIGGNYEGFEKSETSDCHAIEEGYVSVTPITIDCTHDAFYTKLKEGPKL